MSEQVRFKIEGCKVNPDLVSICITFVKDENGEYVRYEDYARLKDEVERLRKAGDAMADAIEIYRGWIRLPGDEPLREAFNRVIEAMKEGKPSV